MKMATKRHKKHKMKQFLFCAFGAFLWLSSCAIAVRAQLKPSDYTRTEAMIPMRDGVRLYTQIDAPANAPGPLPILLLRTPYGLGNITSEQLARLLKELSEGGYIFVRQDIRGRFKSEGEFVMLRQPRDSRDKNAIDEGTDTYDTIAWLLSSPIPNFNSTSFHPIVDVIPSAVGSFPCE